jgi:CubicO group peptidase (beta-lactamase class C family)
MSLQVTRRSLLKLAGAAGLGVIGIGATRAARTPPGPAALEWRATGQEVPELAAFETTVQTAMQEFGISCGALAVTYNSRLVLARGYTWSDNPDLTVQPTSLFRIASLTKPITATAVLRLVQQGELSLSDKLTDLLTLTPAAGQTADPRLNTITLLELLQHRGGWDRTLAGGSGDLPFRDREIAPALGKELPITVDDIITFATGLPLDFDPGTAYVYSNYGYLLLGRIIEAVSGMSYSSYVQEQVFGPLRISDTRQGRTLPALRDPREVPYVTTFTGSTVLDNSGTIVSYDAGGFNLENLFSGGAWVSSVPDLARFAATFDQPESSPVLSSASMDTMFALSPLGVNARGFSYGCGWRVYPLAGGERRIEHDGVLPGTLSFVNRLPNGVNWVALFNQSYNPNAGDHLQIEARLNQAAGTITAWPDHDLFETFFPAPTATPTMTMTPTDTEVPADPTSTAVVTATPTATATATTGPGDVPKATPGVYLPVVRRDQ